MPGSGATLVITAEMTGSTLDPSTGDNTDDETTVVLAAADLPILSRGDPGPLPPGVALAYTLDATNSGPGPASARTVVHDLPVEAELQSASGTG